MIEIRHISKTFGSNTVLNGISASFLPGKTNLIIGASGSGKTVLMKCMVGLLPIDKGEILYDNRNLAALNAEDTRNVRKAIGMLFQGTALFDSLTVEENVMFPLNMFSHGSSFAEKKDRVNFCLERVKLPGVNKLSPAELSGGMKKRVGLARAIVQNPQYLFCDEPNSGLDPQTASVIDELIRELTEEFNTTTVINTHDMNSVMNIGDKIIFLHKGKKYWEGSNKEVLSADNKELNEFIFVSKFLRGLKEKS